MARSWWDRNWFWSVPCGCCLGCLFLPLLLGSLVAGGTWYQLRGSGGVYDEALDRARANPELQVALGKPIEANWFELTGESSSVNISFSNNDAELTLPLEGPDGRAVLFASASKHRGEWTFHRLEAQITGREGMIDLLSGQDLPLEQLEAGQQSTNSTDPTP